jgi:hypothetical protein
MEKMVEKEAKMHEQQYLSTTYLEYKQRKRKHKENPGAVFSLLRGTPLARAKTQF